MPRRLADGGKRVPVERVLLSFRSVSPIFYRDGLEEHSQRSPARCFAPEGPARGMRRRLGVATFDISAYQRHRAVERGACFWMFPLLP